MIHSFYGSLEKATADGQLDWIEQAYRKTFPDITSITEVAFDTWGQKSGIDKVITLGCGKTILVEEKIRDSDWPDIALEIWAAREFRQLSWALKSAATDYLCYIFLPSREIYLFPFPVLRQALLKHGRDWAKIYQQVKARNQNYTSVCLCIPKDVLIQAVQECMFVRVEADQNHQDQPDLGQEATISPKAMPEAV